MREMKDSGISWIGDLPSAWATMPIKYNFTLVAGATPDSHNPDLWDGDVNWITPADFKTEDVYVKEGSRKLSEIGFKSCSTSMIPAGSIIFSKRAPIGTVAINTTELCTNQGCLGLVKKSRSLDNKYYYYVLSIYPEVFNLFGSGTTFKEISATAFGEVSLPFPPINEQHRISTYLDAKCAEIDALTADIQTQIDTLEQYKRSVITETVTKGLNPDAEMKDSGIDGAGVTPSHWKTTRLCYECYIRARLGWRGLKADEYVDEGYAFISAFNIQNGKLVWTPLNYITKERFDESPEIKLHSGDVLIVKDGAGVGKCARVDDLPMGGTAPNSSIAVITPNKNLDYRYVCYYLQSAVFNNFVLLLYNGMGVPHLTQEVMSKIKILLPPLKEQMVISDYLDAKCTEIDAVVETKKSQLAMLDEYKESLIFEYVTGKKEVPAV